MSVESMMLSKQLILYHPLLQLLSIFPSIRVFSSELALCIRWPKDWRFSFIISPSSEYSALISLRIDWFDYLKVMPRGDGVRLPHMNLRGHTIEQGVMEPDTSSLSSSWCLEPKLGDRTSEVEAENG